MWRNETLDSHPDEDDKTQGTKSVNEEVIRLLLKKLGSKLKQVFYYPMQEHYYRTESLLRELKVRSCHFV